MNKIKLKEITSKIGSGATPRGGKNSYKSEGISLIRSMNVYDSAFEYTDLAFINEMQAKELSNVQVERNDILLNITGASVARCCMVPDNILPARVNQHVSIIRIRQEMANPRHILYCLISHQYKQKLLAIAQGGATREALTKEKIEDFEILVPSLSNQHKIASILSAYDDLIENNNRRIKILEEMAQAIYREWFVNFRFPGHEKVKMVKSELGMIPEGWEVAKVGDLLWKIERRPRVKKEDYLKQGEIPAIDQGAEFIGGYTNDHDALHDNPLPIIVFGDHTRIVKYIDFPFASGADGTQLLYPENEELMPAYFYYTVKNIDLSSFAYARHFKFLKEQEVLIPDSQTLKLFNENVGLFLKQTSIFRKRNDVLRKTRDLLLPKLISGEIDVENMNFTGRA